MPVSTTGQTRGRDKAALSHRPSFTRSTEAQSNSPMIWRCSSSIVPSTSTNASTRLACLQQRCQLGRSAGSQAGVICGIRELGRRFSRRHPPISTRSPPVRRRWAQTWYRTTWSVSSAPSMGSKPAHVMETVVAHWCAKRVDDGLLPGQLRGEGVAKAIPFTIALLTTRHGSRSRLV